VQQVARAAANLVARLTRRKEGTSLEISSAMHAHSADSVRLSVHLGFPGSLEERVERLQEIAQRHEDRFDEFAVLIGSESEQRRAEIRSLRETLGASERKLEERINEAAANGLTLETRGVVLFALGVVLSTWGGLIG
jgi:hypothetical protein